MPKKLKEQYDRPQFNVPADKLIEAVKKYLERTEGEKLTPAKVREVALGVVENRL